MGASRRARCERLNVVRDVSRPSVGGSQKGVAPLRCRQAFHRARGGRSEGARSARATRKPLQSETGLEVGLRCGEVGEKAGGKGVAAAHRIDDRDGKARRPRAPFDGRQQSSACAEGDRDQASPRPPQARKTLLDIRYAGHDGQLFLTDLEDIGLLGCFERDGAHLRLVPPQRRSQIDVDGDEDARLTSGSHRVALRGGADRLAQQQAADMQYP